MTGTSCLVLGGGGVTGVAWELGIIAGLAEAGIDLTTADRIVGTSAGSVVGAQLCSGVDIETLYARQLEPPSAEKPARMGPREQLGWGKALLLSRGDITAFGRRIGHFAIEADRHGRTPTLTERLDVISSRLPKPEWSERDLRITVVDADSGECRVITRDDGIALRDAVAASCAVPGVYPPVPIGGRTYVDGGVHSGANAQLGAGCAPVVVIAPLAHGIGPIASPRAQLNALGVPSVLVTPNADALHAIGANVLDPAHRADAARAGRKQAAEVTNQIRSTWK